MDQIDVLAMSDDEFADFERKAIQAEVNLCLDCPTPGDCMAVADCVGGGIER